MNRTNGSIFLIQSLSAILFAIAILLLVFNFWPKDAQMVLSWIYFVLGMISGVLSLAGIWSIAKNCDEQNDGKVVQSVKLATFGAATAIPFQIAAVIGFVI